MRAPFALVVPFLLASCAEEGVTSRAEDAEAARAPSPPHDASTPIGYALDELPRAPEVPFPFLLVHGFAGFSELAGAGYFYGVEERLRARGLDVTAPALPPVNGSSERARVLADVIDATLARTGARKVHVIAHSQGGLDMRHVLVTHAHKVASVTTVATPHAGTEVARLARLAPDGTLNPAGRVLAWALGLGAAPDGGDWSDGSQDAWTADLESAFASLTPEGVAQVPPVPPDVPFFSYAGVSNGRAIEDVAACEGMGAGADAIDPLLATTGAMLFFAGANDGLVTVESARAGTFMGCIAADHADEIGAFMDSPPIASGFDHLAFYDELVELAWSVE